MTHFLRAASAIATLSVLAACAATTAGVKPNAAVPGPVADNPACLNHTASRIPDSTGGCSASGRSYSSEDIQSTGSPTADEALRLLDPTVTVHR
ncbi:MAG: hypothetical protein ACYDBZ_05355 [Steroidobacteraceae bacterium]